MTLTPQCKRMTHTLWIDSLSSSIMTSFTTTNDNRKPMVGLKILYLLCLIQMYCVFIMTRAPQKDGFHHFSYQHGNYGFDSPPSPERPPTRGKVSSVNNRISNVPNTQQLHQRGLGEGDIANETTQKHNASNFTAREPPVDNKTLQQYVLDLVVTLQASPIEASEYTPCSGFLLRDDLVLTSTGCARGASSVDVPGYASRVILSKTPSPNSMDSEGLVLVSLSLPQHNRTIGPQYHENSGWPRLRLFLGIRSEKNSTTTHNDGFAFTSHHDDVSFHIHSDKTNKRPVLFVSRRHGNVRRRPAPLDILKTNDTPDDPFHSAMKTLLREDVDWDDSTIAEMVDINKGERWWVRKENPSIIVDTIQSWINKHSIIPSEDALSVGKGLGLDAVLKLEDPMGGRRFHCLRIYFIKYANESPFSREPFFQWLDYGSGRYVEDERCPREKLDEKRMNFFTEEARSEAAVNLTVIDNGKTIKLNYAKDGAPVATGQWIFVRGLDKVIYIAQEDRGTIGHDAFFTGGPILHAGEMFICNNGSVLGLNSKSGHYRPSTNHSHAFFQDLKQMGAIAESVVWAKNNSKSFDQWRDVFGRAVLLEDDNVTERCIGDILTPITQNETGSTPQ